MKVRATGKGQSGFESPTQSGGLHADQGQSRFESPTLSGGLHAGQTQTSRPDCLRQNLRQQGSSSSSSGKLQSPVASSEAATKGTQAIADLGASSGGWPGHLALLFVSRGRALMLREAPAGHLLA